MLLRFLLSLFFLTQNVFADDFLKRQQFFSNEECLRFKSFLKEVAENSEMKAHGFCQGEMGSFVIVNSNGENPNSDLPRHVCTQSIQQTIIPTLIPVPIIFSKIVKANFPVSGEGKTKEEAMINLEMDVNARMVECDDSGDIRARCELTEVKCYTI